MRFINLLVVSVLVVSPAGVRAQDTTRVRPPAVHAPKVRRDSLADSLEAAPADTLARQKRDSHCFARESVTRGTVGLASGAFIGAALSAIPAGILSLFKFHDAARMVFWIPTGGLAALFGFLGFALGPVACP